MEYIYPLHQLPEEKEYLSGGKARSLSHMMKNLKVRIPNGYVLLSNAFTGEKFCENAGVALGELVKNLSGNLAYAVRS